MPNDMPEYIHQMYPTPPDKPDYAKMAQACLDSLATHPEDRDQLLSFRSLFLHYAGHYAEAIKHGRQYIDTVTDPDCHEEMHRFLVHSLEKSGDKEGALAEAETIIKSKSKDSSFIFDDAIRLAKELKRSDKVIELTALEIEAQGGLVDTEVYTDMAQAYDEKKEYLLSHEYYVKAAQSVNDETSWMWNNAGRALALAGKEEEAMFYFRVALAINPKSAMAHYYIGHVYQNKDEVYRAMHHYTEALKIQPEFPEVYNNMAAIQLSEESDIAKAIENLHQALAANPSPHMLTLIYMNLSRMYKKIADYDQHELYNAKMMETLGFDVDWEEGDEDEEDDDGGDEPLA